MRTQGVGVQAVVELREMEVQTSVSLPDTVAALWHCQVPRTIIDMSPQEVESRVEDEHDQVGDHLDSTDVGDDEEVVPCRETNQFQDNIFLPVDAGMLQKPPTTATFVSICCCACSPVASSPWNSCYI